MLLATASVAAVAVQLSPILLILEVTTAPRWLRWSRTSGDFIYRPRAFDVGVVRADDDDG